MSLFEISPYILLELLRTWLSTCEVTKLNSRLCNKMSRMKMLTLVEIKILPLQECIVTLTISFNLLSTKIEKIALLNNYQFQPKVFLKSYKLRNKLEFISHLSKHISLDHIMSPLQNLQIEETEFFVLNNNFMYTIQQLSFYDSVFQSGDCFVSEMQNYFFDGNVTHVQFKKDRLLYSYYGGMHIGQEHGIGCETFYNPYQNIEKQYNGEWRHGFKCGEGALTHSNGAVCNVHWKSNVTDDGMYEVIYDFDKTKITGLHFLHHCRITDL